MNPRRVRSSISPIVPGILAVVLLIMLFSAWTFVSPVYAYTFLSENFDGVTEPALPAGWANMTVHWQSGSEPKWATFVGTTNPSGHDAHSPLNVAYFNVTYYGHSKVRLYTTSSINLSGASSPQLTFWMFHDSDLIQMADAVQPQVSTDGGTSWGDVGAAVFRYDITTGWRQKTVDLSAYAGQTDVRIGFLGISEVGHDCIIDDVEVTGDVQPAAIPTLTEWGIVLFIGLLGIVSVYHLRRRGKTV